MTAYYTENVPRNIDIHYRKNNGLLCPFCRQEDYVEESEPAAQMAQAYMCSNEGDGMEGCGHSWLECHEIARILIAPTDFDELKGLYP